MLLKTVIEDKIIELLKKAIEKMSKTNWRLESAAKFIEFFINDMLDYAVLLNKGKFIKDMKRFRIKESIEEIKSILESKITTKNIKLILEFENFADPEVDEINTD